MFHNRIELFEVQRLRTIGKCMCRVIMYFNHQTIGTAGNTGFSKRLNERADTGCMAWVNDDRKMGTFL